MKELSQQIMEELRDALKQFGTYNFDDKGPNEVMDTESIIQRLRELSPTDAATVLIEVATSKKHRGRGLILAMDVVTGLQDWDDLFAIPGIDEILNGDLPGSAPRAPIPIKAIRPDDFLKELLNK